MARTMAKVKSVAAGSPAARAGLMAGDVVLAVDGYEMIDIIDWRFLTSDYSFTIFVERGGVELELQVFRDEMAELGVEFEDILFDGIKECANRCVFCFVDQLPDGVRSSLCIKDDDYRLSFLQGNFVTLTNCSKRTLDRIVEFRMSPIYVSVHATDHVTRNLMLGRKSTRPIMEVLRYLGENGIEMHTQIVVVPGMNDGYVLKRSIDELSSLRPSLLSIGIVPVGLTKHRKAHDKVRSVSEDEAKQTLDLVEDFQSRFVSSFGTRLVWASDEYYLKAGRDFPNGSSYEGYVQLENGIGLARSLSDDVECLLSKNTWVGKSGASDGWLLTGTDGAKVIGPLLDRIKMASGSRVSMVTVPSTYFGGGVTVTGLVTGSDIVSKINRMARSPEDAKRLIIPDVMLRDGEDVFLDGMSVDEVAGLCDMDFSVVSTDASGLLEAAGMRRKAV